MNQDYERWYVESTYRAAGRPKLESALMGYATKYFQHCTIYDKDLNDVVSNIKAAQEKFYKHNRRLKKVNIVLTDAVSLYSHIDGDDGAFRRIKIGEQSLLLRKVREEIECVDPQFPMRYDFEMKED